MSKQSHPILTLPIKSSGQALAHRFITIDGALPLNQGERCIGVTRSSGESGELLAVDVLGTAIVELNGSILAGKLVTSGPGGRAVEYNGLGVMHGIALQGGLVGDFVEVLLVHSAV